MERLALARAVHAIDESPRVSTCVRSGLLSACREPELCRALSRARRARADRDPGRRQLLPPPHADRRLPGGATKWSAALSLDDRRRAGWCGGPIRPAHARRPPDDGLSAHPPPAQPPRHPLAA